MDEQESFDTVQDKQQNEVQEEQNVQMEPTPLSSPSSHTKLIIGIVVVFVLGIAGAYIVFKPQASDDTSKFFIGVPTNYSECIQIDEKYVIQKGLGLECQYTVYEDDNREKFTDCVEIGGEWIEFTDDSLDPNGSDTNAFCQVLFYNPNYVFPKNFNECEDENKGHILGGDGSKVGGVLRPKTCLIAIEPSKAFNKEVATRLMNECIDQGGKYSERTPICIIIFNEP